LLVTGYADVREAVGAMRDGALDYLSKPIDLDELLASVQRATGMCSRCNCFHTLRAPYAWNFSPHTRWIEPRNSVSRCCLFGIRFRLLSPALCS